MENGQMKLKKVFQTDKRTALIRKNIIYSFLIKGGSGLIFLLIVPLTLKCLGVYQNGVWLTISGALIWLDNMDIGLGNGLRNKLAVCLALNEQKKAKEMVSSTFFMLILIVTPITLALLLFLNLVDLHPIMDAERQLNNLSSVLIISVIFVCTTFIFKFIGNFYQGLQLPAISNLITTGGHILALIGTYILYCQNSHSIMAIAIVNTASPLLVYLLAYPYTFFYKYKNLKPAIASFRLEYVRELFNIGIKFFILQMCGALIMLSINFLISKFFSPSMVTPYQLAYRYFSIMLLAFTIITTPIWSATTDAWAKKDYVWINKTMKRTHKILLLSYVAIGLMCLLSNYFYKIWIGELATVPFSITLSVGFYTLIYITIMAYSYFLNGIGALRLQLIFSISTALLFIPLACLIANLTHNIISILVLMSIINLPCIICNHIQFNKIIKNEANGFWKI